MQPNEPLLAAYPSPDRPLIRVYETYSETRSDLQQYWMRQPRGSAFLAVMYIFSETVLEQQEWTELTFADFLHGTAMSSFTAVAQALTTAQAHRTLRIEEVPGQPWRHRYALDFSCVTP